MFLLLSLNYWLIHLIPVVITQILKSNAELVIAIGIQTKEAKAEIETHPIVESFNCRAYNK